MAELLLKYSNISRHFVQRLKLAYGKHGGWGNNISNNVYESILNFKEGYGSDNRNDMQSIRQILEGTGNEDDIIAMIENYGFAPFPPSFTFRTYIFEHLAEYKDELPQNVQTVAEKLCDLQSIGFSLTDTLVGNAILLFKGRLVDVGESLIESFSIARELSKEDILDICLIELLNPTRNLEQYDALDYIINLINDPEKQILSAFEKYSIVENGNNPLHSHSHRFLKYSLVVYRYMLKFGAQSPVVRYLMKEIIVVHTQLTNMENVDKLRDADTILDEYYTANVPFEQSLFSLFKECSRTKPISYLFERYLPTLFGFEVQHQSFMISKIPEVDALMSPTQTEELKKLWLDDIQKCVKSEELVNDEFRKQITEFFTLYDLSHSSFDHYEQLYEVYW
ncbi:9939_t:CDS:2 [Paraglomus brasilianum]|uniref:9939_t:CDS:1 n=1 Tax=Paraglomus brasilianum TaxID=144538 RepID=A0A9N9C8Y6_9GLOM|nr:9939_t:CDS:2 [Paraglomus brasilianum]